MAEHLSPEGVERVEDRVEDDSSKKEEPKKKRRHIRVVQLQEVPETISGTPPAGDVGSLPLRNNRPFAVLLRFRVTQIVAGIVTVLLGAVACLDDSTRLTLGMGIPSGVLTVLASVAHIQATRREYQASLLPTTTGPAFITSIEDRMRFHRPLDIIRPLVPTLACVLACLLLLALSCMAAASFESNRQALGAIQAVSTLVILITEVSVWTYRWKWMEAFRVT